jgi:hypothetical protein
MAIQSFPPMTGGHLILKSSAGRKIEMGDFTEGRLKCLLTIAGLGTVVALLPSVPWIPLADHHQTLYTDRYKSEK